MSLAGHLHIPTCRGLKVDPVIALRCDRHLTVTILRSVRKQNDRFMGRVVIAPTLSALKNADLAKNLALCSHRASCLVRNRE